jgi:hypothetical protein
VQPAGSAHYCPVQSFCLIEISCSWSTLFPFRICRPYKRQPLTVKYSAIIGPALTESSFRIAVFIPICALANDTAMNQSRRTWISLDNDLHLLGTTCFFLDNGLASFWARLAFPLDYDLHLLDTTCIFLDNNCFLWKSNAGEA